MHHFPPVLSLWFLSESPVLRVSQPMLLTLLGDSNHTKIIDFDEERELINDVLDFYK